MKKNINYLVLRIGTYKKLALRVLICLESLYSKSINIIGIKRTINTTKTIKS